MTITLSVPGELERELEKAAKVQGKDVVAFLLENLHTRLRSDVLPEGEAELLIAINAPIAPEARAKRDSLLVVQEERELTHAEQTELQELIDSVELANAARWQAIANLAQLRGCSLPEIASQLQIPLS